MLLAKDPKPSEFATSTDLTEIDAIHWYAQPHLPVEQLAKEAIQELLKNHCMSGETSATLERFV